MTALRIDARLRVQMDEVLAKIAQKDEAHAALRNRIAAIRAADERGREIVNRIHDVKQKGGENAN